MKTKLSKKITKEIKTGEIKIKSSVIVWLEKIGLGGLVSATILGMGFIFGFIYYWYIFNTPVLNSDLLNNMKILFHLAPFAWILVFGILFFLLLSFLRQYDFSYKKPFSYILIFILFILIICGYFFNVSQPSKQIYKQNCDCVERFLKIEELKKQGIILPDSPQSCSMME
jgi:glucan phosphoethanolaminetransferase (alkaline phosphatase superfamily)